MGDIACDRPLLKAAHNGKTYDFSDVFKTEDVFSDSDLVVGNLESCFGGSGFGKKTMHYNVPDSFAEAIKKAGIDFLGTANNHCMDEGVSGLKRTLKVLKKEGIEYTGTFAGSEKRYVIKTIQNIKVAFFALTYSVNRNIESYDCDDLFKYINIIGYKAPNFSKNRMIRYMQATWLPTVKKYIKKARGKSLVAQHTDSLTKDSINQEWISELDRLFLQAREKSDVVCVLLHSGGQFNPEPGEFSKHIFEHFKDLGADIIIGHHPHTIQKIMENGNCLCAYSLGGYCLSPSADYLVHESLPEYSMALHVTFNEFGKRTGYEIDFLKCVEEDSSHYVHVMRAERCSANIEKLKSRISGRLDMV